jgi:hypothetical protein
MKTIVKQTLSMMAALAISAAVVPAFAQTRDMSSTGDYHFRSATVDEDAPVYTGRSAGISVEHRPNRADQMKEGPSASDGSPLGYN